MMTRSLFKAVVATVICAVSGGTTSAANYGLQRFPGPRLPAFGPATRVDAVNAPAPAAEGCPIESADGRSLFFASNRTGDPNEIWVSDRSAIGQPWQPPRMLEGPINQLGVADFCPTPVFGRSLMFVSTRAVSDPKNALCVDGNMYISRQSPAGGWSEPSMLGCAPNGPNTAGAERSPSLVETPYGTFLFYSTNGTTGHQDIHVSVMRADGTFGPGRVLEGINSPSEDLMPNVRERPLGGYEMVFSSNRPSSGSNVAQGGQDVYVSTTWFLPGPWSPPVNVSAVNTTGNEQRATLSQDGMRLYFGRDGDIFVSPRL
jgi:hypothetical protein